MKVLVIGQGGREHALVWKLKQSPQVSQVFCAPGNAGTAIDGTNVPISETDIPALLKFAQSEKIDLTIPGPEAPLVAGVVDAFRAAGLTVFGPVKEAARLEGSKLYAKQVMKAAKVPTADYATFDRLRQAEDYLRERCGGGRFASNARPLNVSTPSGDLMRKTDLAWEQPVVVKADGLAAGKGVKVCHTLDEALEFVRSCFQDQVFGEAGSRVLIEECLVGEEASILAIIDGKTIIPLEASQDHKAAYDGDTGPNTGGMGAYCPTPLVNAEMMDQITHSVLIPMVHEMKRRGAPFTGVLYAGLMLTRQGPKVLEFNVRFGDPETQPVLMRLQTDLFALLYAAATGKLREFEELSWDPRPAVCVVMASEGYPGPYKKGQPIRGLESSDSTEAGASTEVRKTSASPEVRKSSASPEVKVFHAGTAIEKGQVVNTGGRVLGVTALGENLDQAKLNAYARVKTIRWDGAWCRKDISDKARKAEES